MIMSAAFDAWAERARAVRIEAEIERRGIKLRGGSERVGPCPKCGGEDRFSINISKQFFNCRGCDKGGDVIALVEHLDGVDFIAAGTALTGEPPPRSNGKDHRHALRQVVTATFEYQDENGAVVYVIERVEYRTATNGSFLAKGGKHKKTFRQRRPDPDHPSEWIWNVGGVAKIPYRLPELIEAVAAGHPIYIPEGEGKVDALREIGIAATCNPGGAGKWLPEFNQYLRGADVVLLPDNDEPGWKHINDIGASLAGIAGRVRVLALPNLAAKGDIRNWLDAGGTREQLDALVEQAPDWQPPPAEVPVDIAIESAQNVTGEVDEDAVLERLEKLPPGVKLAREIKRAAKQLGVSQDAINDELEARRGEKVVAPLHDHWIVEPWPEPVDGDSLLRDIVRRIRRHIVCSHDDALAIALWVMFAWVHDAVATHSPILNINSAEPESGKSTTLGLISFLVPRCVSSVEISEAALYRAIELWQPCFVIDEFDSVLASDDKSALRSIINSGHTRGQGVIRCVEPDLTPRLFKTFCPKAIGMVGRKLPATTLGRCIIVELRRRKTNEAIERFAHKDDAELSGLRSRLGRWAIDNEQALHDTKTPMPDAFDNRRADNWRIMLAIADLAGEDWAEKARLAAGELEGASDTSSIGVRLLTDIKRIFDEDGRDCILSALLVDKLKEDPEGPWAEWGRGKGLTQNSLAVLLGGGGGRGRGGRGGFGIRSQGVHPSSEVHGKGYKRSQFEDAWARYLPAQSLPFPPEGGQ
jgi:hypothetical protein